MAKLTMTAFLASKNPSFFLKTLQDLPDFHRLTMSPLTGTSMKARAKHSVVFLTTDDSRTVDS
jgi:hypothetical protein